MRIWNKATKSFIESQEIQRESPFHDKTYRRFYEGDFVKFSEEFAAKRNYIVYPKRGGHIWFYEDKDLENGGHWVCSYNHEGSESSDLLEEVYRELEICGNVFETPGLMDED